MRLLVLSSCLLCIGLLLLTQPTLCAAKDIQKARSKKMSAVEAKSHMKAKKRRKKARKRKKAEKQHEDQPSRIQKTEALDQLKNTQSTGEIVVEENTGSILNKEQLELESRGSLPTKPIVDLGSDDLRLKRQKQRDSRAKRARKRRAQVDQVLNMFAQEAESVNRKYAQSRKGRRIDMHEAAMTKAKRKDQAKKRKARAQSQEVVAKGVAKSETLQRWTERTTSHIINLDPQTYNDYLHLGPRPYYLIAAFTALSEEHDCQYCHSLHETTIKIAEGYYQNHYFQDIDPESEYLPVYFVEIDLDDHPEIFRKLQLVSAPTLVVIPPKAGTLLSKKTKLLQSLSSINKYQPPSPEFTIDEVTPFLSTALKRDLNVFEPVDLSNLVLVGLFILVAIVAFIMFNKKIRQTQQLRIIFVLLAWGFYTFCVSGGMYNFIRNVEWSGLEDNQGNVEYIDSTPRTQFGAEGFLMGLAQCSCGFLLSIALSGAFQQKPQDSSTVQYHIWNVLTWVLSPLLCTVVCVYLWHSVISVYTRKSSGYNMGWLMQWANM